MLLSSLSIIIYFLSWTCNIILRSFPGIVKNWPHYKTLFTLLFFSDTFTIFFETNRIESWTWKHGNKMFWPQVKIFSGMEASTPPLKLYLHVHEVWLQAIPAACLHAQIPGNSIHGPRNLWFLGCNFFYFFLLISRVGNYTVF